MTLIITLALIDFLGTGAFTQKPDGTVWYMGGAEASAVCIIAVGGYTPNEVQDSANWCVSQVP